MKTAIEDYNTKFEAWRQETFDLKPSEVRTTKLFSLSVFYETAKNNPDNIELQADFYRAIKAYDNSNRTAQSQYKSSCISFDNEDKDMIINFGDTMFFIEDARQEIEDRLFDELDSRLLAKEQIANKDFDFVDYAVENLNRWEVIND
jgi:hypothetical protein